MVDAEVGYFTTTEWPASTGGVPCLVELFGDLLVAQVREVADYLDCGGVGVAPLLHFLVAGDGDLVGSAGVPADTDAGLGDVGLG